MAFKTPILSEEYEFIEDDNYIAKYNDLFWYSSRFSGDLAAGRINMFAGRTLGELKKFEKVIYYAIKTNKLKPYFPEKINGEYPRGF